MRPCVLEVLDPIPSTANKHRKIWFRPQGIRCAVLRCGRREGPQLSLDPSLSFRAVPVLHCKEARCQGDKKERRRV